MLEYLNHLKEIHTDDESRIALSKIETALTEKKYGLVWEEHEEEVDRQLIHNIPVFREIEDKKIVADENADFNFLLEGDNLHSLKLLEKTHKGKVDVIYIDPPYNTKNKEFIYNDTKIGEDDGYRHSKWLSFMAERLKIAKDLLSDEGVIFISIDDNEQAQLKLLCDEIFGESNHITSFVRKTKSMTGDDGNGLNIQHDYIQIYAKDKLQMKLRGEKNEFKGYSNPDNDPNGTWISGDPSARSGGESTYFPIENPITGQIDYPPSGRYWAFSKDTFNRYVSNGRIKFREKKRKNQRGFIFKRYAKYNINQYMTIPSLVFNDNIYMNSVATTELKIIFKNSKFDYPKPKSLVKKLTSLFPNSNSIIIDFFAGERVIIVMGAVNVMKPRVSGTLNKYILCIA
ncbi:site-specific DNA-methyltransferase [Anaerococcus sp. WCA-380-WT-2B]|uniref:Site-specific DNA-methyltransferase n=2 Tax=Anaerococcus porci TaxID=2652269 RepID=A0A6N7VH22_9FIRM|nr:site-specific DNA-methyltransferase [Anaerococcus porci]